MDDWLDTLLLNLGLGLAVGDGFEIYSGRVRQADGIHHTKEDVLINGYQAMISIFNDKRGENG